MVKIRSSVIVFPCVICIGLANVHAHAQEVPEAPLGRPYLLRLADRVASWRSQLSDMDDSAKRAADGTIAGGNLYVFGPQPSFVSEVVSRASGLMLARPYSSDVALTARDTVLAALIGSEDETKHDALRRLLVQADQAGSQVVVFGCARAAPLKEFSVVALPRTRVFADDCDIASVSNVVGMWAWTGRFIAACTRQGKMPCVYQSHLLPDARERTDLLQQHDGGRFHFASAVRPQDAERIAESYLNTIEHSLRQILATERAELEHAALLIRASRSRGNTVAIYTLGHMFPGEFHQPHQPDWLVHVDALQPAASVDTALMLYHMSFPHDLVDKIRKANQACIVICSQSAPADFTDEPGNVYLNPHWPIYDGVVELPNYDVHLLPASGVLNAAVYWQIVERATANPEKIDRTGNIPQ